MGFLDSQLAIIPFYKRGSQGKCCSCDGKAQGKWSCRPAPVMERDSVNFPFPQIHRPVGTTPFSSPRRQADGLCCANHGSIGGFSPIAFSGCPRGHTVSRKTWCPKRTPNGILDTHPRTRASGEPTGHRRDESRDGLFPDAQAACCFRCSASKPTPFFQTIKVMAAILRARVRRAIVGFIPLATKAA